MDTKGIPAGSQDGTSKTPLRDPEDLVKECKKHNFVGDGASRIPRWHPQDPIKTKDAATRIPLWDPQDPIVSVGGQCEMTVFSSTRALL